MTPSCSYTFQPADVETTTLEEPWNCPHETVDSADRCLFHLRPGERDEQGLTDKTVSQRFRNLVEERGQVSKRFVGAMFGDLDLSNLIIDAPDRYPIDLRHATIDGSVDFSHSQINQPLDFRNTDLTDISLTNAEITERFELSGAVCRGELQATAVTVEGDFDAHGTEFQGPVLLDEGRFHGDACFRNVRWCEPVKCRGVEFEGDANLLADDACFEESVFEKDVAFTKAQFRYADFVGAVFKGEAEFEEVTFEDDAEFRAATFEGDAVFRGAEFHGDTHVRIEDADFADARFGGEADFRATRFRSVAFSSVTFESAARFADSVFAGEVGFTDGVFADSTTFDEARFHDDTSFESTEFGSDVSLRGTEFHGGDNADDDDLTFEGATVRGEFNADRAEFSYATFEGATFESPATFHETYFTDEAVFTEVQFEGEVLFTEGQFGSDTSFASCQFDADAAFAGAEFEGGNYVEDDDVTFEGARFSGRAEFECCRFQYANFTDATVLGPADFRDARFNLDAVFDGSRWEDEVAFLETRFREDVSFEDATFNQKAVFRGAEFQGGANTEEDDLTLADATFEDDVDFHSAEFRYANFEQVQFHGRARFGEARFDDDACFTGCWFGSPAVFEEVRFDDDASFKRAVFEAECQFEGAEFHGGANVIDDDAAFDNVAFRGDVTFRQAEFGYADFSGATFEAKGLFEGALFSDEATFSGISVANVADFDRVRFEEFVTFRDAEFTGEARFDQTRFDNAAKFVNTHFHCEVEFTATAFQGDPTDLSDDADFADAKFDSSVTFDRAEFRYANFVGTSFQAASFDQVTFREGAAYDGAHVGGDLSLCHSQIMGDASLTDVVFEEAATFSGTAFEGGPNVETWAASFENSEFQAEVTFDDCEFQHTNFVETTFSGPVSFDGVTFEEDVSYDGAHVSDDFDLRHSRFVGSVSVRDVVFEGEATFTGTIFNDGRNEENRSADFGGSEFHATATFVDCKFQAAAFVETKFGGEVSFKDAQFGGELTFQAAPVAECLLVNMRRAVLNVGEIRQPDSGETFYDMSGTTIRDVTFEASDASECELLDYFLFVETDFDGFDFSKHMRQLSRNNWTIHGFRYHEFTDNPNPDVVRPDELTPSVLERTYLMAKNSADEFGHRKAVSEFYIKEFTYRRKKNGATFFNSERTDAMGTPGPRKRLLAGGKWFGNWVLYETCGYGERIWRILYVSILVIVSWAFLYLTVTKGTRGPGDVTTTGITSFAGLITPEGITSIGHSLYFSLVTFTTLGYGDVQPIGPSARLLASFESFLGALLLALVVFVIGRRMA